DLVASEMSCPPMPFQQPCAPQTNAGVLASQDTMPTVHVNGQRIEQSRLTRQDYCSQQSYVVILGPKCDLPQLLGNSGMFGWRRQCRPGANCRSTHLNVVVTDKCG